MASMRKRATRAGSVRWQVRWRQGEAEAQWFQRAVDSRPGANNRTRSDYRRDFVTHIPEWLACKPIETISREDVGRWLTELQKSLAPKTIHNIHGMVSSVMKDAQTDGLLTRNPFLGRSKSVVIRHEEMVFLSPMVTAWKRQPGGAPLLMDPKSARPRHTVTLTPRLVELLRPLVQGRAATVMVKGTTRDLANRCCSG
jgi:hypothetical protein